MDPRTSTCALAALLLLAACDGSIDDTGPGTAGAGGVAQTNLLLITLDTARVDRLGAYGHAGAQTPNLDSLARDGARFTRAYAHVPLTLPSHASLLTGTFPPEHGIHDNGRSALGPELTTLAELFRVQGYRTGAFIAAVALDGSFGLDRGFDVYDDHLGEQAEGAPRLIQRRGDSVVDDALSWLNQSDQPFFAWVHLYDPHARYEPPADFAMADPYDGEISFMDAQIGRLLGWLDSVQLADETLVVAIADHGESLGEHGEGTHGSFIYEGTQHIPLLVRGPGVARGGLVCEDLVQQADLLPTLLELHGWPRLGQASGRSFAAALRGESIPETTVYLESDYCALNFGWSTLRGIVHGKWKLIQAPTRELYDLERDPGESTNLAQEQPQLVASLERQLEEMRGSMSLIETTQVSPGVELSNALSELGYAQGFEAGRIEDAATGLNPIEHVEALELYHLAAGLGHMGRPEGMIEPLEEVVRRCPDSAGFRALLGESYLSAGRLDDALRELERAQELDAGYDPTYYYLGRVHARMGNVKKAVACLEATLELNPTSLLARRDLGLLLWQEGDHQGALAHFERITEEDPNSPQAWLQLANVQAELGRWPAAAAALGRATELAPQDWGLVNFRAWVLSTAPDDSVVAGALAVELAERMIAGAGDQDPNLLDTLAAAYARAGRFADASATALRALELARDMQDEVLAAEIAGRLELYRAERPYQDG